MTRLREWLRTRSKGWLALIAFVLVSLLFVALPLLLAHHDTPRRAEPIKPTTTSTTWPNMTINVPPVTVVPGPGTETKEIIQQPTVKIIHDNETTTTQTTTTPNRTTTTTSPSTTTSTRPLCVITNPVTC